MPNNVAMKASELAKALMLHPDCEVGVMVRGRVQAVSGLGLSGEEGKLVVALFFVDFISRDEEPASAEPRIQAS